MPKDIGDILKTGAAIDHLRGCCMPEGMRSLQRLTRNAGPSHGSLGNLRDRRGASKRSERRPKVEKNAAALTGGSPLTQIGGKGTPNGLRQR